MLGLLDLLPRTDPGDLLLSTLQDAAPSVGASPDQYVGELFASFIWSEKAFVTAGGALVASAALSWFWNRGLHGRRRARAA